ncbi:SMC-Scp complex subunit ScpB [Cytophagaceae bacterium DM2B3-1]|uniref:SMC-Scp complex subunit ScpB n=1 Tax=Xanthocytophaga flava TaxID=3048013 RepID=A0AAE3QV07_9BACT|nr:SMC-Scp complex subunit ScpB [Xanthocytophaga flavus]MDJ1470942.1 SMC-Scp complex subunit ScpB [Xanthocytophaga flavus]MDJ1484025.1 SMC-Scp complex subunit ScpB [Xanthocytophaga flavus]MDJ1498165.1 SMC-Scp complex subunit ScpB [Xanthocytophaga flavus]
MNFLQNHVEALIFCSAQPIKIVDIQQCLSEMFEADIPKEDIENAIQDLLHKYQSDEYTFGIYHIAEGYQFLTKPAYQASIGILLKQSAKKRLSTAALETVAIIAYKQPITKTELEHIRGVNCDYAIQKLLDKELIEIMGKAETLGRPLLYGTSKKFMEYFGIQSMRDLPQPKDFATTENEINPEIAAQLQTPDHTKDDSAK